MATANTTSGPMYETIRQTHKSIDRRNTINLEVKRSAKVEVIEVIKAFRERGYIKETRCLQQVTRNKFRWSLSTEQIAQTYVRELYRNKLIVGGNETLTHYASRTQTFILYDTPWEMSDNEIIDILDEYGEVINIRRTFLKEEPTVHDGKIVITMMDAISAPHTTILLDKGGRINVRSPGEKPNRPSCRKCNAIGDHLAEDCPLDTICHSCKLEGHRYKDCPSLEKGIGGSEEIGERDSNQSKGPQTNNENFPPMPGTPGKNVEVEVEDSQIPNGQGDPKGKNAQTITYANAAQHGARAKTPKPLRKNQGTKPKISPKPKNPPQLRPNYLKDKEEEIDERFLEYIDTKYNELSMGENQSALNITVSKINDSDRHSSLSNKKALVQKESMTCPRT